MSNQTPDPWQDVKQRRAKVWEQSPRGLGPGGSYSRDRTVYLATDVDRALAAERAQHQHEIAERDETNRQQAEQIATLTAALERIRRDNGDSAGVVFYSGPCVVCARQAHRRDEDPPEFRCENCRIDAALNAAAPQGGEQ